MVCKVYCPTAIEQDIGVVPDEGYNPYFFPAEGAYLPFFFTEQTFLMVFSALCNGAYTTYGDEGRYVIWEFLRNVEYPVSLCDQIAECIATSEATQAALRNFITTDPAIREYMDMVVSEGAPMSDEALGTLMADTADLDALFGAVTYLVDTMNGANEDLYQAIEASSNNREGGQILFNSIPVIETLPLDEVSEYVDFMVSSVAENYAAAYTTTPITGLRDRIRCGLFCLAVANDNTLNWQQIADYFWNEVGFTFANAGEVIGDFVTFVTTGTWSGEEIATISFANIASVLTGAQVFADMTFPSLQAIMNLGLNDPDPDWATLCDECAEPPSDNWITTVEPPYETGTIINQTPTSVEFEAEISFDGIWRVNADRAIGCPAFTNVTVTGATITYSLKTLCAGGTSSSLMAIGDEVNHFTYAASGVFTVLLEW